MNKGDLEQIKNIIDSAFEKHLAVVHEEISDVREEMATKKDLEEVRSELGEAIKDSKEEMGSKVDALSSRFGAFENREVDKRVQLEVRVSNIEAVLQNRKGV